MIVEEINPSSSNFKTENLLIIMSVEPTAFSFMMTLVIDSLVEDLKMDLLRLKKLILQILM